MFLNTSKEKKFNNAFKEMKRKGLLNKCTVLVFMTIHAYNTYDKNQKKNSKPKSINHRKIKTTFIRMPSAPPNFTIKEISNCMMITMFFRMVATDTLAQSKRVGKTREKN